MIHRIKIGTLDPRILKKEERQMCVEALIFESASPSWICQFLKVSDRTVRRDLEEIRSRHALSPDSKLAREIIGEFVIWGRIHRGNLMKLARNASASVSERAQAELYAFNIMSDTISKLQSLGYLPKSADALVVMEKKDTPTNEKVTTICEELDEMTRLVDSPEEMTKLISLKEILNKEEAPNHDPEPD
jgi:hypothetical protein